MSDEEKKAIESLIEIREFANLSSYKDTKINQLNAIDTILNLIEKQSKEIEELKEDRKKYAEGYIHNNPWLYKQLNENYILIVESEQKERKAYIKGTNDAHELCNKKWEDKIKAKIEELEKQQKEEPDAYLCIKVLQSLLEKE